MSLALSIDRALFFWYTCCMVEWIVLGGMVFVAVAYSTVIEQLSPREFIAHCAGKSLTQCVMDDADC